MAKRLSDTALFKVSPDYGKRMIDFIMSAERINTSSTEFADILFDIKRRRISDSLSKVIVSKNVVLGIHPSQTVLPKAFRAFVAQDIKTDRKYRMFIDCTDFVKYENGTYTCKNESWLISYVISGITNYIYSVAPQRLLLDTTLMQDGCDSYTRFVSYIIDRIYKTTSVPQMKKKIDYVTALFYLVSLMDKDATSESQFRTCHAMAVKISQVDDRDARMLDAMLQPGDFKDLNTLIAAYSRIFNLKEFKVDVFVSKWIEAFGTSTPFGIEYFPHFCTMMTDAYVGGYINNQFMIEKITANSLGTFVKALLKIGDAAT